MQDIPEAYTRHRKYIEGRLENLDKDLKDSGVFELLERRKAVNHAKEQKRLKDDAFEKAKKLFLETQMEMELASETLNSCEKRLKSLKKSDKLTLGSQEGEQ